MRVNARCMTFTYGKNDTAMVGITVIVIVRVRVRVTIGLSVT